MNGARAWSRRLTVIAWMMIGVVHLVAFSLPAVQLPGDAAGWRHFQTPEIAPDAAIGQTFEMTADGLSAIEFSAVAVAPRVSGDVRIELHDLTGHGDRVVHTAVVPASDLVRARSYRFEFPPVPESGQTLYGLRLAAQGGTGVALVATRGERYLPGAMSINDMPRWADLAFRTYAPAPSRWEMLVAMGASSRLARGWVIVGLLAVTWVLVGGVLRVILRLPGGAFQGATT